MNKLIFKVAVVYLVILLSVLLGMLVQMQYGVAGKVSDVVAILKDNLKNEVSDARDGVRRFQVQSSSSALISAEDYADYFIPNTKILFEKSGDGAYRGGYIVQGTFEFGDDSGHMALLLDNDGTIVNRWELTEDVEGPPEPRPFSNKFPHGLELFDDGSIIYAFDVGVSLSKKSYCGKTDWTRHDLYHHSVQKVDETSVYAVTKFVVNQTSRADGFQLINVADGAVLKSFTVFDILKANPDIDPLGIRQEDFPKGSVWTEDPFHTNDIEALPPELSGYYPEFSAGDLLISMRSLNLVMVVSPDDLKIKWFRQGYTRRQHDPDWTSQGIAVYDNRMHLGKSEILLFQTGPMRPEKVFTDEKLDFYSFHRGKQDWDTNDNVLITSPQEGRAFGVDRDGEVFVEILNLVEDNFEDRLTISQVGFVEPELIDTLKGLKCD